MKKRLVFGLVMISILILTLVLTGCGGGGSSSVSPVTPVLNTKIIYICDTVPDLKATAYKSFLESAGCSVNIIGVSSISSADFSGADLIIMGIYTTNYNFGVTAANKIYDSHKPIICINCGNSLYSTGKFATAEVYINYENSAISNDCDTVHVEDANESIWSKPNKITVTTSQDLKLYSIQSSTQGVNWDLAPASAHKFGTSKFWVSTYRFAPVCADIKNNIKYAVWGFSGVPNDMTPEGKKLFQNLIAWVTQPIVP